MIHHKLRQVSLSRSLAAFLFLILATSVAGDPFPTWNEEVAKSAIVDFVTVVTREGAPDLVPVADHIPTFDNDGTLGSEQPAYFQLNFAAERMRQIADKHPERRERPIVRAAVDGDSDRGGWGSSSATPTRPESGRMTVIRV